MLLSEAANPGRFFSLVPLIVFFPIAGLLINILLGGKMFAHKPISEKLTGGIASLASGLAFVISVLQALALVGHPEGVTVPLAEWISIGALHVDWAFRVDTLSVTMMLVVSGVGTLIHIYAIGYMHEDVRINGDPGRFRRFFVFLNLFIAAMMILVSGSNFLMLFVGWEGVGLCSFLLIGFWHEKGKDGIGNALAAKKAFVTNRVGDFGFLIAMFLIFGTFGSLDFESVFQNAQGAPQSILLAITLFMLLGVAGKSAQLPLYVWLPDAMAGPTPVSALIHAATMVTAGVYLVARSAPLYTLAPQAQATVAIFGAATALFAATIALGQFDIKKVLAYSTISQLGFMVAAVGMGAFTAGMFHLVTHAFFKALLFLSAGSVIQGVEHGLHHIEHNPMIKRGSAHKLEHDHHFDPQDMRNMGGLKERMKTTFWVYLIGALALAGIFPFAGFWSKDEILAEASHLQPVVYWMLTIAAFFTAFYMGRQVFLVFFGKARSAPAEHAQENPPVMLIPLVILAVLSVIGGTLNLPYLHSFEGWLAHTLEAGGPVAETALAAVETTAEAAPTLGGLNPIVALFSTALAVIAIFLAWRIYFRHYQEMQSKLPKHRTDDPLRPALGSLFTWLENKWYVDELYWALILNPYIALSRFLAQVIDWRFWHDWFHDSLIAGGFRWISKGLAVYIDLGGIDAFFNSLAKGTQAIAARLRLIQTGYVRNYALAVMVGAVAILFYLIWILQLAGIAN